MSHEPAGIKMKSITSTVRNLSCHWIFF